MAEESGALQTLGKVIPSIYYDLIARVCARVPFLVMLLWDRKDSFGEITWVKLALLLGAGYVAGLVLTTLTVILLPVDWVIAAILEVPTKSWQRNDAISERDKDAGATLAKMQAEATLCQNLFCAFLLLIVLHGIAKFPLPALDALAPAYRCVVLLMFGLAAIFRTSAYLGRQERLYKIYVSNSASTHAA